MARRYDGFSKTSNETPVVTEMLSVMSSLAGSEDESSVDIWMFKPNAKRGRTVADNDVFRHLIMRFRRSIYETIFSILPVLTSRTRGSQTY